MLGSLKIRILKLYEFVFFVYEIEVPKNSRVSRTGNETCDEIVFPRSSQFECIGTERIKDADKDYLHVKLRYIQPKEPWRTS